jgi:hypothetical protein
MSVQLWNDCKIPYAIGSTLVPERIQTAIEIVNRETNFLFVPKIDQDIDYILFENGDSCRSYVGKINGKQIITIANFCNLFNIVHELLHSIGLIHTMRFKHRDNYITLLPENIDDNHMHNYLIDDYPWLFPYDYSSLMHYSLYSGNNNKNPAFSLKQDVDGIKVGQRYQLSNGDLNILRYLSTLMKCHAKALKKYSRVSDIHFYSGNRIETYGAIDGYYKIQSGIGTGNDIIDSWYTVYSKEYDEEPVYILPDAFGFTIYNDYKIVGTKKGTNLYEPGWTLLADNNNTMVFVLEAIITPRNTTNTIVIDNYKYIRPWWHWVLLIFSILFIVSFILCCRCCYYKRGRSNRIHPSPV